MELDHAACYRALAARDRRFDGRLFVAVKTTRIYCRPICPARTPKSCNVIFYATAAAAAEAGFRPCLRCRPEVSPELATWNGTSNTVARALRLIEAGASDEHDLETLATRLGVGARHLRRLFARHLGASPIAVVQTRRVHLAKQLIHETQLPMVEVALAAGFGSVRRFNETFKALFGRPPSSLRRRRLQAEADARAAITLQLPYSAPYAWPQMLQALAHDAFDGVESVQPDGYVRSFCIGGSPGLVSVRQGGESQLRITVHCNDMRLLQPVIARIRRVFDLGADPTAIDALLSKDTWLAPWVAARPGLRTVGTWDSTELCWRAVLRPADATSAREFALRYGERLPARLAALYEGITHVLPSSARVASAARTPLAAMARFLNRQAEWSTSSRDVAQLTHCLMCAQLPAVLAQHIAMAQLQPSDLCDLADPRLCNALQARGWSEEQWLARAQRWRPWRAYAMAHLLAAPIARSLSHERSMREPVTSISC
jgi:AraC family transcriptional regulator of adaptative response / DNA-3-methyladenine glycosylase II